MKPEPRWIYARRDLAEPCDGAGCQSFILRGDWYYRATNGFRFCARCATGMYWTTSGTTYAAGAPPRH